MIELIVNSKKRKSQENALLTPELLSNVKMIKYADNTYEKLPGIKPDELSKLYEMGRDVIHATSNYEFYRDEQLDLIETMDNAFIVMIETNKSKDLYKQSLDRKYR